MNIFDSSIEIQSQEPCLSTSSKYHTLGCKDLLEIVADERDYPLKASVKFS